ncbi:regulator of G-protein signaling 17 isoform X2 [Contarinia nasturtii]|uniref:regulator of G-protein signaling 17 isoform X2 n=1 Tax=Contarinia nasturtii TaxID=265458 RepID=UPI0012D3A57A|nr:regulator of G-protein signaling 17 isoform X2 [Contarinia nasturtii]
MSCSVAGVIRSSVRLRGSSQGTSGGSISGSSTAIHGTQNMGGPPQPESNERCCICWCCCWRCSWIQRWFCKCGRAVGNAVDNGTAKKDPSNAEQLLLEHEQQPPPTLDEIRSWGKSFDKLMHSPAGRKVFRDFLCCEYSEENILFWLACEELKVETSTEKIEEKARLIYENYISILSPKEVSLDSRVREVVNRNMVDPTPNTFDEAQIQIYTLMHRDSYPRFVNSTIYKGIAQFESLSASGSKASESPT